MIEPANNETVISVFGSHAPRRGDGDFELALSMGRLLAEAGFTVATGGYSGVMEAVSQGAAEAGGQVIGVTSAQIERSRMAQANAWVTREIKYESLRERLLHLVVHNQGIIVLPGGVGTLSEFALAWSFLQVEEISPRPLIVLGQMWTATLEAFVQPEYLPSEHLALVGRVESPHEALAYLTRHM
jgi:uncharacterized protein (TIGR00730 family)